MATVHPRVSVIMAAYNAEAFLGEAIEGVLAQGFTGWELIVANDGSTDRSSQIARACQDERIRVYDFPNRGQTVARCQAISMANADLLAICDADDVWEPEKLQRQLNVLDAHPEVGVVGSARVKVITEEGEEIGTESCPVSDEALREALYEGQSNFVHSAVVVRRDVYDKVGGYRAMFRYSEDYDLMLRLAEVTQLFNVPGPALLRRRLSGGGIGRAHKAVQRAYAFAALKMALLRRRGELVSDERIIDEMLAASRRQEGESGGAAEQVDPDLRYAKVAIVCGRPWRAVRFLRRSLRRRFRPTLVLLAAVLLVTPGPLLRWVCTRVTGARPAFTEE